MFGSWPGKSVQDLQDAGVILVEDGNHGEQRPLAHEFVQVGRPFVRPDDLKFGRVAFDACDRINDEAVRRVRKGHGRPRDVLFTHRATVGRMAIVEDGAPLFVANPGVTIWRALDPKLLDYRFLYYWMHSHDFLRQVWAVAGSTDTFPYVSLTQQRRLLVATPPIDEQTAIASTLGALDDKIDLNRRMNETLEAMARAIFQDWFVTFGPTRAKQEGRPPYLAPDLWSLFPDRLGGNDKPEGWGTGTLADVSTLNPESWSARTMPAEIEYLDLSSAKNGEIEATQQFARDDAPSRAQRILRPGDTVVGTVRPGNRSFALIAQSGLTGSTGFAVLRPKSTFREFVYLAATADDAVDFLAHRADGAAYPAVRPDVVSGLTCTLPPDRVAAEFSTLVAPLIDRMATNRLESRTLATTRDLLLPKLMSGELRVKDAEHLAEAAL